MTEWISLKDEWPPHYTEVLCKHEEYPNYWVGLRFFIAGYDENTKLNDFFRPTICTCCDSELHGFKATHWRFIEP